MGYFPLPQNDASHYSNGGWEYHQEMINDQANQMRYCPEPQNDLCHYLHGSWAYQQEYEQPSKMNNFPEPQNDSYCDEFNNSSNCAWENQNQKAFDNSYSTYQELSSLEQTFNSFMERCQTSPPSSSFENSSLINYPLTQNLFQNSHSTQTSMDQSLSRLETMLERYEREAQRSWNDQENSLKNMEVLVNQMLSVKEGVEEQEEEAPVSSKFLVKNEIVEIVEPKITDERIIYTLFDTVFR
ncbi:hypothetical protein AHAS_Ahas15G0211500 [Arachis hypogaea]